MTLNPRQTLERQRIGRLQSAIQEAIDKMCEKNKFQITSTEINVAIIRVLQSHNGEELKTVWEKEKNKDVK